LEQHGKDAPIQAAMSAAAKVASENAVGVFDGAALPG
jgi:hypothetical protein